jgi:hypothetical protein
MYAEKHARRLASPHSGEAAPESEHAVTDAQPAT